MGGERIKRRRIFGYNSYGMLRRITAIVLLAVAANGGMWIALSCAGGGSTPPSATDVETGDYCTIMCRAHGHDCVRESKEETCICPDAAQTLLLNAMFYTPAVIQPAARSAILFSSESLDVFKPGATMNGFIEFPSPPPKS